MYTVVRSCGDGARSQSAVEEFAVLAEKLPDYLPPDWSTDYGYLEFANPVIRDGLDKLREAGCDRILAVPGMLFAAMHAKNDIPTVLNTYAAKYGITVSYGRELGIDPKMIAAAEGRLQHVARLPYKRVIVFPYFLFSGILIDRIYGFTDQVAAQHPTIQFVKAGYLGDHPKVLETFAERILEQDSDSPPPNCGSCGYREQVLALEDGGHHHICVEDRKHPAFGAVPPPTCVLCKYRVQVLGFEAEVGAVQESHHHHVEGQGANAPGSNVADCTLCDTFCTGMCRLEAMHHHHDHHHHDDHDHHHHHAPYPHADHPHGPESARKTRA